LQSALNLEAWRAARADYAAALRRKWQVGVTLGPLSFAGLGLLALSECPPAMHFAALGGGSAAMLLLWFYLGERSHADCERAGAELRAAEGSLGQRPLALEPASPDRMVRVILAVFFLVLWAWTWAVRPDCTAPVDEESDLTAFSVLR
jgi:hypothetical protein